MSGTAARKSAPKAAYRCAECGWTTTKWVGRCGECQAWGTVEDASAVPVRTTVAGPVTTAALPILDVDAHLAQARPTGVPDQELRARTPARAESHRHDRSGSR